MCISEKGVKPALTGFCRHAKYLGGALLALIIDLRWSNTTLTLILNESVEDRRNELLEVWVQHRFADLERINITGVLVAGVISSAFSWYTIPTSPWLTRALWYVGLLFSMAAIVTAGVHSAGLHRLGCHPDWHSKLQQTLGVRVIQNEPIHARRSGEMGDESPWRPRALQPLMWQTPGFLLKLAITCFLVGLVILVWSAATQEIEGEPEKVMMNDMKIAILFTVGVATSMILYMASVVGLFFKTVK